MNLNIEQHEVNINVTNGTRKIVVPANSRFVTTSPQVTTVRPQAGTVVSVTKSNPVISRVNAQVAVAVNDETPRVIRLGGTFNHFSGGSQIEVPFNFGDATPKNIAMVAQDKVVFTAAIVITEYFDGVGASLSLGDDGDSEFLIPADHVDPTEEGEYEANPGASYLTATQVKLFINPGVGPNQGSGIVLLEVQQ